MGTPVSPQQRTYSFSGKLIKETPKALFIRVDEVEGLELSEPKTEWFPKSQITDSRLSEDRDEADRFNGKHWIMEGKNLI